MYYLTVVVLLCYWCLLTGNYYSIREQHEHAARYFQRALKLNPNFISAWTLMGHEYMEMNNQSAAIQAYRQGLGKIILLELKGCLLWLLCACGKHLVCSLWLHIGAEQYCDCILTSLEMQCSMRREKTYLCIGWIGEKILPQLQCCLFEPWYFSVMLFVIIVFFFWKIVFWVFLSLSKWSFLLEVVSHRFCGI